MAEVIRILATLEIVCTYTKVIEYNIYVNRLIARIAIDWLYERVKILFRDLNLSTGYLPYYIDIALPIYLPACFTYIPIIEEYKCYKKGMRILMTQ